MKYVESIIYKNHLDNRAILLTTATRGTLGTKRAVKRTLEGRITRLLLVGSRAGGLGARYGALERLSTPNISRDIEHFRLLEFFRVCSRKFHTDFGRLAGPPIHHLG